MALNVGEDGGQKLESVIPARFGLLIVPHGALPVEFPETNLGMNLERPLLALWRHCVVHLLDLPCNSPCLLTQAPFRHLQIDRACLGVVLCSQNSGRPSWKE